MNAASGTTAAVRDGGHLASAVTWLGQRQPDLFGLAIEGTRLESRPARPACMAPQTRHAPASPDPEAAARLLNAHDHYRVLRRLRPRPVDTAYRPGPGEGIALLVDVETTGLDHRTHEVIEIGMVAFAHDAAGQRSRDREPGRPGSGRVGVRTACSRACAGVLTSAHLLDSSEDPLPVTLAVGSTRTEKQPHDAARSPKVRLDVGIGKPRSNPAQSHASPHRT